MMPELTGRKITLIGGAGFIGHNLALALRRCGAEVDIVDGLMVNNVLAHRATDASRGNRRLYLQMLEQRFELLTAADIPLHVIDARDYYALSHVLGRTRPEVIIHLAAVSNAAVSNKDPYSTFDHSLRTLENALDNARSASSRVEQFVYFSSSMVYGTFASGAVTEETPCDPVGIYGALKLAGERMVIAYHQVFDLPYTIIRPSALYGPRCVSRRVGQVFIENALSGQPLRVQGDGADRLDFTYIDDLVAGVQGALTRDAALNQTFNVTYGAARSIAELAGLLKARRPDCTIHHLERDRLMPKRGTLSIDKARRLLGYEPQYPLERGFQQYMEWYEQFNADNHLLGQRPAGRGLPAGAAG